VDRDRRDAGGSPSGGAPLDANGRWLGRMKGLRRPRLGVAETVAPTMSPESPDGDYSLTAKGGGAARRQGAEGRPSAHAAPYRQRPGEDKRRRVGSPRNDPDFPPWCRRVPVTQRGGSIRGDGNKEAAPLAAAVGMSTDVLSAGTRHAGELGAKPYRMTPSVANQRRIDDDRPPRVERHR
jgi:hypothetical protein